MSAELNIPENKILHFLDSHLALIVIDFHLKQVNNSEERKNLLEAKKNLLQRTNLSEEKIKFVKENGEFDFGNSIQEIKDKFGIAEENLKKEITGFLNLTETFRKTKNFDTTSSINKKIVN